jgi:hypothetical protein
VTRKGLITFVRLSFASIPKLQLPPTVLMVCLRPPDGSLIEELLDRKDEEGYYYGTKKVPPRLRTKRYYYDD